jgi:cytochrome d ubiquinol oxidase subunit I
MVTAAFLTTGFVVAGISAWFLLKYRHVEHARIGLGMSLGLITVLAPLQIVLGDLHGLNTLEHQPTKVAAMEGHWEGGAGAPLILFALPDMEAETNHWEVGIPELSSLILTHSLTGEVPGLLDVPAEERPYVPLIFWTFRIMVGLGLLMLVIAVTHVVLRLRGRLYEATWFHRLLVVTTPIGFVAIIAGWITTEVGRQPWIVYGLLPTADGVTPSLTGAAALVSLVTFLVVYALIFTAGTYYIVRLLQLGPKPPSHYLEPQAAQVAGRPMRPMSKTVESFEPGD